MPEIRTACTRCHNPIDSADQFCDYCGLEIELEGGQEQGAPAAGASASLGAYTLDCRQCGAVIRYDARAGSPRCPFCGSVAVEEKPSPDGGITPEKLVTFGASRDATTAAIHSWLARGFCRPSDLAARAQVTEMRPVYLPYWLFACTASIRWTADCSATLPGARADWRPVGGDFAEDFKDLLIAASGGISQQELRAVAPYDFSSAVPFARTSIEGAMVEDFRIPRKSARRHLYEYVAELATTRAAALAPGSRSRNVHVNPLVSDTSAVPVLLPVWIAAYRYHDRPYRVVVNGQTGKLTGRAPVSWVKVSVALAIVAVIAISLLAVAAH